MSLSSTVRDAEFLLSEGDIGYSRDLVTMAAESGVKPAGTLLKISSGKYIKFATQADTCAGILLNSTDTTTECKGVIITRHAQVKRGYLNLTGHDADDIAKSVADLAALGIIVRD